MFTETGNIFGLAIPHMRTGPAIREGRRWLAAVIRAAGDIVHIADSERALPTPTGCCLAGVAEAGFGVFVLAPVHRSVSTP